MTLRTVQLRFELTDLQLAQFQGYWDEVLSGGSELLEIELPFGDGFKTCEIQFVSGYRTAYRPVNNWLVSVTASVLGQVAELLPYIVPDGDAFVEASDEFHVALHYTLPPSL